MCPSPPNRSSYRNNSIDLNEIAQSRSLPAGFVFHLMLAEGVPFAVIKERLQTTAPTISLWKQRFLV